jgi:uncharacterized protein (DUF1778 family)
MVRPRKPEGDVKKFMVTIRVTDDEREALRRAADIDRRSVSDWLRLLALDTAQTVIAREGKRARRAK